MTDYAVDLFCGARGWDVHEDALGIESVGIDNDPSAVDTSCAAGFKTIHNDVRRLSPAEFPGREGLIASPPCQTFSMAGKGSGRAGLHDVWAAGIELAKSGRLDYGRFSDERTGLVLEPLRWALEAHRAGTPYRWIALEQVPSVLVVWDAVANYLRRYGYSVATGYVFAEQFGVPQTRKRAILIARLDGVAELPAPTHRRFRRGVAQYEGEPDLKPWVSMAEALGWGMIARPYPSVAPGTDAGGTDPQALGGSGARRIITTERAAHRWIDKTHTDAPEEWQRPFISPTNLRPHVAIRHAHEPAPTMAFGHERPRWITAGQAAEHAEVRAGGNKITDHNAGARVTVAEVSVLQSFPPDYPWHGYKKSQFQQVGNAIPPLLARAVLAAAMGKTSTAAQ